MHRSKMRAKQGLLLEGVPPTVPGEVNPRFALPHRRVLRYKTGFGVHPGQT